MDRHRSCCRPHSIDEVVTGRPVWGGSHPTWELLRASNIEIKMQETSA